MAGPLLGPATTPEFAHGGRAGMFRNRILALALLLVLGPEASAQPGDLREAARLDREGKCEEAEPYYQRALAAGEPSAALLNNVGNHYVTCGQDGRAREYFERLLGANPAHRNANLQVARILTQKREGARALEHLDRVPESDPAMDLLRGEALHWAGRHAEAIETLDRIQGEAGDDPRVTFSAGLAFARMGLYGKAEAAFSSVLTALPGNFDVLMNLGRAASRAGHHERARRSLETALRARPNDLEALFELGLAHAASTDSAKAVFLLAQARQRAPDRPDILLALAQAAEDAEYFGDAVVAFDEYLAIRPGDTIARRDRARCAGRTQTHREEGLRDLARYIERHPDDARARYDLAHLTWEPAPAEALDQLAEAIRLDPDFAAAHVSRAWLLHRLGRTSEAVPHLETAIRVQPNDVRALDQLGLVSLSRDDAVRAEEVLRRAIAISPEDPEVLLHLGQALMALGRPEEARVHLARFQRVRPAAARRLRTEAGMIELAGLPPAVRRRQQIDRFRILAESRPDDHELRLHLANLLLADGEPETAATEFRFLLESSADSATLETAGRSLLSAEQYELAREFLQRAVSERPSALLDLAIAVAHADGPEGALQVLERTPDSERAGDYFLLKARLLDATGRIQESLEVLSSGVGRGPARPEVARDAAILLAGRRRTDEALQLIAQALEFSPDNPDLMLARATVLALSGRDSASGAALERIQSRWPEWDRPYLVHGLLLEHQGQSMQALENLRTAKALGSDDALTECAITRLEAMPETDRRCDCARGLADLVAPDCNGR